MKRFLVVAISAALLYGLYTTETAKGIDRVPLPGIEIDFYYYGSQSGYIFYMLTDGPVDDERSSIIYVSIPDLDDERFNRHSDWILGSFGFSGLGGGEQDIWVYAALDVVGLDYGSAWEERQKSAMDQWERFEGMPRGAYEGNPIVMSRETYKLVDITLGDEKDSDGGSGGSSACFVGALASSL